MIAPNAVPVGAVIDYAGPTAPTGWLLCYGQVVSTTAYAALYAAIGTAHNMGGDAHPIVQPTSVTNKIIYAG